MMKNKQSILENKTYEEDFVLSRLLACEYDIVCINKTLQKIGSGEFTLEEIGLVLGITRERIRQIESSALRKLRRPIVGCKLKEYAHV